MPTPSDLPSLSNMSPWARGALWGFVGLGAWLRWQGMYVGFAPDEFANVHPGNAWDILVDAESAINPPIIRWIGNVPFGDLQGMWVGRFVGWVASVASLPLMYLLAARASRSTVGGLMAMALLTVAPVAVQMACRYRSYALWVLFALVHLLMLSRLAEGDAGARDRRVASVSAVLLGWTHYLAIPVSLILAPVAQLAGWVRGAVGLWVPAALTLAPMGIIVFGVTETRVATPGSLWDSLGPIVSGGFPAMWGSREQVKAVFDWMPAGSVWIEHPGALVASLSVLAALVAWRRLSVTARICAVALVALLVAILAMSMVQFVRSPVGYMWWCFSLPLLASLVALPRTEVVRMLLASTLVGLLSGGLPLELRRRFDEAPEHTLKSISTRWRDFDAWRDGGDIWVHPGSSYSGLHIYLTGKHVRKANRPGPPCDDGGCFLFDDVAFRTLGGRQAGQAGVIVAVEDPPDDEKVADCELMTEEKDLWVYACDAGS